MRPNTKCNYCGNGLFRIRFRMKVNKHNFCNLSCTRKFFNKIDNPMKGKNHSEESKNLMRKNNPRYWKNKELTTEHRKKISESSPKYWEGKHRLEETKAKIRKKLLGVYVGEKNPMWGKNHTKETKTIISLKSIGRKHTKESIKKIKEWRKDFVFPTEDTQIEIKIQNFLSKLHIEYFTHKYMSEITHSYQCDIFIPKQETEGIIIPKKTIIECDGCFFHACPICKLKEYEWTKERRKLDKKRTKELIDKGYMVIRLWEHDIKKMELNDLKGRLL